MTLDGPLGLSFPIWYMKALGLDAPLILHLTHVNVLIKNKNMSSVTTAGGGGRAGKGTNADLLKQTGPVTQAVSSWVLVSFYFLPSGHITALN